MRTGAETHRQALSRAYNLVEGREEELCEPGGQDLHKKTPRNNHRSSQSLDLQISNLYETDLNPMYV